MCESRLGKINLPSVIVSALLLAHCSSHKASVTEPPSVDVSGTWYFKGLSGGVGSQRITATLRLTQNGSALSGTHTNTEVLFTQCGGLVPVCANSQTSVPDGSVTGSVAGNAITLEFNADDRGEIDRYQGTMSGADRLQGTGWTADRQALPSVAAPTALEGSVAQTQAGFGVALSWKDNSSNESGFAVAQSCDGEDFEVIGLVSANGTSGLVPPSLITGTVCSYFVLAFVQVGDEYWPSQPSNTVTVTLP